MLLMTFNLLSVVMISIVHLVIMQVFMTTPQINRDIKKKARFYPLDTCLKKKSLFCTLFLCRCLILISPLSMQVECIKEHGFYLLFGMISKSNLHLNLRR